MFVYTEKTNVVDSTAVKALYYNEDTKELGVTLHSGQPTYVYKNVPLSIYKSLREANSVGSLFAAVKKIYGPAVRTEYQFLSKEESEKQASNIKVSIHSGTIYTSSVNTASLVTLGTAPAPKRKVEVWFTLNGDSTERTFATTASTVENAVAQLTEYAGKLGLETKAVKVVFFV